MTRINEKLLVIAGAGGNVVVCQDTAGLILIDGGLAERSRELFKLIGVETKGAPIRTAFNTHWHWDHTGSNEALTRSGAKIIAHENTRLWLGADFFVEWEQRAYKPRPREAWPTETFYTSGKLTAAGEEIAYGNLPRAHTDGDIYIFFPTSNVLVAGGLLSSGSYPVLDYATGGWIGGMLDATKALLDMSNAETRYVPAYGPLLTRADVEAQHAMLTTMKDRLLGLMKKGMGPDDMIAAAPTQEFDAKWGDPTLFVSNAYKGMWGHVRSLGGIV